MRTRRGSKRTKIRNESRVTSETDLVPRDLVIEILRRLPSKSLARFLLVSKLWKTIIRSRNFIRSFPFQNSLLQPRLLFAFKDLDDLNSRQIWIFYSSSSASGPLSYLSRTTCSSFLNPNTRENYINEVPRYVNGLISFGSGREQVICNPSTGKSITLPKVKSRKRVIRSFFGYDPVDGHYKVLCMSEKVYGYADDPSFEHQVFTLGGVDKSWRMIECNVLHRAETNGVCINGVVYYVALTGTSMIESCLARFDVRTEKFGQVVQFLGDDHTPPSLVDFYSHPQRYLISYKGKVTLAIHTEYMRLIELWILEDAEKHEWSKVCITIGDPWMNLYWDNHLRITGDIISDHADEVVLVLCNYKHFLLVYYDHKENTIRNCVTIRENSSDQDRLSLMVPFSNYVESVMLL